MLDDEFDIDDSDGVEGLDDLENDDEFGQEGLRDDFLDSDDSVYDSDQDVGKKEKFAFSDDEEDSDREEAHGGQHRRPFRKAR